MEKWEIEIKLKFQAMPFRMNIRFCFEWKAWLIAYDLFNVGPEEFSKMEADTQITALAYGAAYWGRMKRGKKIFFSYEDIAFALNKATKEENKRIMDAFSHAQFPEWLKKGMPEDKKKVKTK